MFGMMVLLIALLKITNSCCVWVPSEAAIFNRNEWYNTVADGPEISLGNDSNDLQQFELGSFWIRIKIPRAS